MSSERGSQSFEIFEEGNKIKESIFDILVIECFEQILNEEREREGFTFPLF